MLAAPTMTLIQGCGCGFDCNNGNDNDPGPAFLTLGFSDEALEDLKQVVLEVDSITFGRSSAEDVVVDTFTITEKGLTDADTFQIDLLDYQGRAQLLVIEGLELDPGSYNEVLVTFLDGDVNSSYVQESDDTLKEITSPSGGLSLPGVVLGEGTERFTVEFSLAQSLLYRSSTDDYLLSSTGIRVEDTTAAASITGRVATNLFDTEAPCDAKTDPESGNRIYIYQGTGLSGPLADVYTNTSSTTIPADAIAPYAVASLIESGSTGTWNYVFGYLPSGSYTMAFSCDTADDHPVDYNGFTVPLPTGQLYELELSTGEQATCDLEVGASCN